MEVLSSDQTLSQQFIANAPAEARARLTNTEALESTLATVLAKARAEWPQISLADELYLAHLAVRVDTEEPIESALSQLQVGDLYLACACSRGDPAALMEFEGRCFPELARAVKREPKLKESLDDIKQMLRERLFVQSGARSPRIDEFSGRASLRTWFRVIAARTVINLATRGPKEQATDEDELSALPLVVSDPELRYMKEVYRTAFIEAFSESVRALSPRSRNLLRYSLSQNLNIDEIALLHSVHRATAARWVADAREALLAGIRKILIERLQIEAAELDSIFHLIRSRIEISLDRVLDANG